MTDTQPIIDVAIRAADPAELEPESRYAIVVPDVGRLEIIEPTPDKDLPAPRRARGESVLLDVPSFADLWTKHADQDHSELFADPRTFTVTAVLNADAGFGAVAGHRDHRLLLRCEQTVAWKAWARYDGQLLSQQDFAEHLEDRAIDVVSPSSAEMLDLAQNFEAKTNVDFKSANVLGSGQRALVYEETTAAKAGQKGDIEIPHTFELGLAPFEGTQRYKVTARFRYRISGGHLAIGYRLERPEDVLREAFNDLADAVSEACGKVVLGGTPPPPR